MYHQRPFLANVEIGTIAIKAKVVNQQPNHEYYRRWEKLEGQNRVFAGRLQFSFVVFSEDNQRINPSLPVHMYDLEILPIQQRLDMTRLNSELNEEVKTNVPAIEEDVKSNKTHMCHFMFHFGDNIPEGDGFSWSDAFIELLYDGRVRQDDNRLITK